MSEDDVWVDPPLLRSVAGVIGVVASEAGESFDRGHGELDAALGGWTGSSRAALSAVVESWWTTATRLVVEVDDHAVGLQAAAARLADQDLAGGGYIRGIGADGRVGPDVSLRLDDDAPESM